MKRLFLTIVILLSASISFAALPFTKDIIVTSPDGTWTDTRAYTTLNLAIDACGTDVRTIVIPNEQVITADTIPVTITLRFERDGSIANSGQLTINTSQIEADSHQIFTGAGDIDFLAGTTVKTSWFADLDEALDVTSDDTVTMLISAAETTDADMAVGDNVTLRWESPFIITVDAGDTLSNVKNIEAGNYQIFAGSGDFDFLDGTVLKLSWFNRLRSVITWVESEDVELVISSNATIDVNDTVQSNINLRFTNGGMFTVGAAVELGGLKNIEAGNYQIFAGDGDLDFLDGTELRSSWFNRLRTATTWIEDEDVTISINEAITLDMDLTTAANESIVIKNGGSIDGAFTATLNGPFEGSPGCFGATVTVAGLKEVNVNCFGTGYVALNSAITASEIVNITETITIGGAVNFDLGTTIIGNGKYGSGILAVTTGGELYLESAATTRHTVIEKIRITCDDATVNPVHIESGREITFRDCHLSGGLKTVSIEEGINITFDNCKIHNQYAARYALYCDSATYVNSLSLINTRIAGMAFIDLGPSGHSFSTSSGTIIEATVNPVCNINRATNISLLNTHFEGSGDAENLLDIDENVISGVVSGNYFGVDTNTEVHILCDGTAISFQGNYFCKIAAQDEITLEANSKYCDIGHQYDGGGVPAIPKVTDGGTQNKVWGSFIKHFWIGAQELQSGIGDPARGYDVGAPYIELVDDASKSVEYLFRLPDDRVVATNVYVDVLYAFDAADAGKNAYIQKVTHPQDTESAINSTAVKIINDVVEASDTNFTKLDDSTGDVITADNEFITIRVYRNHSSASDDTTSHLYIYGLDIRVKATFGY